MSTVVLVMTEVNVPVLMYFETSPLTHVVFPLTLVDSTDLVTFDKMLILKCLFEIEPDTKAFLNLKCRIKLSDVDSCLEISFLQ